MRRRRHWLIAVLVLAFVAGAVVSCYYTFVDTAYSNAEFYPDTGFVAVRQQEQPGPEQPDQIRYEERPGRITLSLSRGEPHGTFTTEHGWWENLTIELPAPASGARIELTDPEVGISFWSYKLRQFPSIGEGGVRGYVLFDSVSSSRIVASYDIVVDGVYPRMMPEYRHRDVVFRGESTFRRRPRPDEELAGRVWPNPER
jgi:hypothetical protein